MTTKRTQQELEELVEKLKWNDELGCYTRQAFNHLIWPEIADETEWLILFDVDKMKSLNDRGGWDKTSAIIKDSIQMRSSDFVCGQLLSGDEFIVALAKNKERTETHPDAFCKRILANFQSHDASATFAYIRVRSSDLSENLSPLNDAVKDAKDSERRGTITEVQG